MDQQQFIGPKMTLEQVLAIKDLNELPGIWTAQKCTYFWEYLKTSIIEERVQSPIIVTDDQYIWLELINVIKDGAVSVGNGIMVEVINGHR